MAINKVPQAVPQRRATDPLHFASEYDALLFDLAELILVRCRAGVAVTHEDYYVKLQALSPEHVEAAACFARDLARWKREHTATVVPQAEFAASLDRIIQGGLADCSQEAGAR